MKTALRIVLGLMCLGTTAAAQSSLNAGTAGHHHVFGIDVGALQLKERNLLPRVHSGFTVQPSYVWRNVEKDLDAVRIALGYGRTAAVPEDFETSVFVSSRLSYSHEFSFFSRTALTIFAGPVLMMQHDIAFFPNWDESHLYWATVMSVGASGHLFHSFGEGKQLTAAMEIPLISAYSRPDPHRAYKIDDVSFGGVLDNLHSNMRTGFWNRVFCLHFSAEYSFPLAASMREGLVYDLDYSYVSASNGFPFILLVHRLGLRVYL